MRPPPPARFCPLPRNRSGSRQWCGWRGPFPATSTQRVQSHPSPFAPGEDGPPRPLPIRLYRCLHRSLSRPRPSIHERDVFPQRACGLPMDSWGLATTSARAAPTRHESPAGCSSMNPAAPPRAGESATSSRNARYTGARWEAGANMNCDLPARRRSRHILPAMETPAFSSSRHM